MRLIKILALLLISIGLTSCVDSSDSGDAGGAATFTVVDGVKTKNIEGFRGVIAESYSDSQEWWAAEERPKDGSPNIIIFLLDDVGFAQVGSFGALINTPNIDALADNGLRYNNFHTTALCSPSRATLMAGRFPHSIGLGSHALTAMGFPGYNAIMPESGRHQRTADTVQASARAGGRAAVCRKRDYPIEMTLELEKEKT